MLYICTDMATMGVCSDVGGATGVPGVPASVGSPEDAGTRDGDEETT